MQEIGGYICLDEVKGAEYHDRAVAVNSGRHAFEYLIRAHRIRKLFLPVYLCGSIHETAVKCCCKVEFYPVANGFLPVFDRKLENDEWLYIVNYYGQISDERIIEYKKTYGRVIIDQAHAFFQKVPESIDAIYTCRKFFGVPDGGYVYCTKETPMNLPVSTSYQRIEYIVGSYECKLADFYEESKVNNRSFSNEPLQQMSKLTHRLLKGVDYSEIKERREKNYSYLHRYLKDKNKLNLTVPQGPYMYPYYHENAAELRSALIKEHIYIPVLWPDVITNADYCSTEYDLAEHILPLPVDQRYGTDEMDIILESLERLGRRVSQ